jgi:hypothetical protein
MTAELLDLGARWKAERQPFVLLRAVRGVLDGQRQLCATADG